VFSTFRSNVVLADLQSIEAAQIACDMLSTHLPHIIVGQVELSEILQASRDNLGFVVC